MGLGSRHSIVSARSAFVSHLHEMCSADFCWETSEQIRNASGVLASVIIDANVLGTIGRFHSIRW